MNAISLQSIHIHPLKSTRGISLDQAEVEARGLAGDRRWMVVDQHGKFISARSLPSMLLIESAPAADDGTLRLSAPGHAAITITPPAGDAATIEVDVWDSLSPARAANDAACRWISSVLQQDCRLVHQADDCLRAVSPTHAQPGDIVSFADGYPLLLMGTASLDELNRRSPRPIRMLQFRPNLVVCTELPFVEDSWRRIQIGSVELDVCKPCVRCVLTTVDPDTGVKAEDGEPLRTLKTFRRSPKGITFGQNLIPRGAGTLRVGDPLEVLELR